MRGLDVSAIPFENVAKERPGTFDCVFAFQVLEHVPRPRAFLLDMVAAAKPGGLIVFSVPNEDSFLHYEVNNVTNLPPHHATRWSDATFERLGPLIGAQLVDISHEPLTEDHRRAYAIAQIWRVISSILPVGRNGVSPIFSSRPLRNVVFLISLPVRLWISVSPSALRGHTVVVTFRKD
jgi:SAM-dependent methyltransferase